VGRSTGVFRASAMSIPRWELTRARRLRCFPSSIEQTTRFGVWHHVSGKKGESQQPCSLPLNYEVEHCSAKKTSRPFGRLCCVYEAVRAIVPVDTKARALKVICMKTSIKPTSGCRSGFPFFDASGNLRQYSWGELKRQGLALYTQRDGEWVRVRANRGLGELGALTAIAPIGSTPEQLKAAAVGTAAGLNSKSVKAVQAVSALIKSPPDVALYSNRFTMLSGDHRFLVELAHGAFVLSDNDLSMRTPSQRAALEAFLADPSELNTANALAELAKGYPHDQWRNALADVATANGVNAVPGVGLLGHTPFDSILTDLVVRGIDPELAGSIATLVGVMDPLDRYANEAPLKQFELAVDLVARFADRPDPVHAAVCYLARVNEDTEPELARRTYALMKAGAITPERALELASTCPTSTELLRAALRQTGDVSDETARAIEAAWKANKRAAVMRFGDAHMLAATTLFKNATPEQASAITGVLAALGGAPGDRPTKEMLAMLAQVDDKAFFRVLGYVQAENNSAINSGDLAYRLCATLGDGVEEYLAKIVSPSEQRRVEARRALIAPDIANAVLKARTAPDFSSIADPNERRAARAEWGNAQVHSREKLEKRMADLQAATTGIDAEQAKLQGEMRAAKDLPDSDAKRTELARIEAAITSRQQVKASKAKEQEALSAVLSEYETATDGRLSMLVGEWVAHTANTPVPTLGMSLHDATFWLPAATDDAASFGEWLSKGDRSTTALKRATGIADLTLISRAWPDLSEEQRNAGFGRVLEAAREVAGTKTLGDRHTATLATLGVAAASAQQSIDWMKASWDTPTPFPMTESFEHVTPEGAVTLKMVMRDNVRGPQQGMLTNCCQHPDGPGRACAEAGQTHPSMGFAEINDAAGNTIAGMWVWADASGGVCFDNIEGKVPPHLVPHVQDVVGKFGDRLLEQFHTVSVGARNVVALPGATPMETPLDPSTVGYIGYRDSSSQLLLRQRSADYGVVTLGSPTGFTYKEGDAEVKVAGDTVTLTGAGAEALAQRMLPQMGPRTWKVQSANGASELQIDGDERFRPRADDIPVSVFALPPETEARLQSISPTTTLHDIHSLYAVCGRDPEVVESALINGWSIEHARSVMRQPAVARTLMQAAPPEQDVIDAIEAGHSLDRSRAVFGAASVVKQTIDEASEMEPRLDRAQAVKNAFVAHQSSRPADALVALQHCNSLEAQLAVLHLLDNGADRSDVEVLARRTGNSFSHHGHPLDKHNIEAILALSPDEVRDLAKVARVSDAAAPGVLLGSLKLDEEQRRAMVSADPMLLDARLPEFIAAGGAPEEWNRVSTVVFGRIGGAELAKISAAAVDEMDAALEAVNIEKTYSGSAMRYFYPAAEVESLRDQEAVRQAQEVVTVLTNELGEKSPYSQIENASVFAALVRARIEPADAARFAGLGFSPRDIAGAAYHGALNSESAPSILGFIDRVPEDLRRDVVFNPAAAAFAEVMTAEYGDGEWDRADMALIRKVLSDSSRGGVRQKLLEMWKDPAKREVIRREISNLSSLSDVMLTIAGSAPYEAHGGHRKVQESPNF
jgi:hypothetical protein